MKRQLSTTPLTRRSALGLGALGLGTLAACNVSTETGSGTGAENPEFGFEGIPDSGADLPTEDVTIGWMDSGDLKAMFLEPFFASYMDKHANITVDYQPSSWDTINEAIPVAVRNNSAPDVFARPASMPTQSAISEGWISPLDDVVPDFEEWKAGFPEGAFIPGVHVFDGLTYTWPMNSSKRFEYLQLTNTALLADAGYDPAARLGLDDLREVCRAVTENGDGDAYGLMIDGTRIAQVALMFAQMLGHSVINTGGFRGLDLRTGEYDLTAPEVIEAFELLLAIDADGSIFPGYISLDDATARSRFPQGVAGILLDGPWAIPAYQRDFPDFEFEVGQPPSADGGASAPYPFWEQGANDLYLFAGARHPEVIGDMFHYLGSAEGQANIIVAAQGNLSSVTPSANELAAQSTELDARAVAAVEVAGELMRLAPDPRLRNADNAEVILRHQPPSTTFADLGQAVFSGQGELRASLQQLEDESNRALDEAISAAQEAGANVSREDWVFANWDPSADFTAEQYQGA
ncbi:ABC transporter substrate-binding protein [Ruania halotolerans]|uniref:ABC transporter substrate-binding protein n=1 Tax=Ruania halotolerans TaxID=2897773 RepID=UPI001E541518|nr:extracellular solute-binding protein [Ruania halotolerans]UFU07754.1 extracellular solute-binding protein [Ruania halotolerans]